MPLSLPVASFGVGFGNHCSMAQMSRVLAEQKLLVQAGGILGFRPGCLLRLCLATSAWLFPQPR